MAFTWGSPEALGKPVLELKGPAHHSDGSAAPRCVGSNAQRSKAFDQKTGILDGVRGAIPESLTPER
jgi:hypothetical protein